MNWNWPGRQKDVLTDKATAAEARLMAIKKAGKVLKKGVEDSLRTAPKLRCEDHDVRRRRTNEYVLGESVANAFHALNEEKIVVGPGVGVATTATSTPGGTAAATGAASAVASAASTSLQSPLTQILERFANLEKTMGHMLAFNESEIQAFMASDTPISHLLAEEIPNVTTAKKDLEQLIKRQINGQNALEKEVRKLDKMAGEEDVDAEALSLQREKRDKLAYELENLTKDVSLEQDKLTSTLLTLVSRENRYAKSVVDLIRIKKQFYENAFKTIEAELPNIERILQETCLRPVFGEVLEDHLRATSRRIAFPIALSVRFMLDSGLCDEGLFRISPKQIRLDKLKAHIDSHQQLHDLLADSDAHLHSALLKSYLRELPVPLLGGPRAYDLWVKASAIRDEEAKVSAFQSILAEELSEATVVNVQYVIKFLNTLSDQCHATKMTPYNIAIVLGPTLLWSSRDCQTEQSNLESLISVVVTLIESYHVIFPDDIDLEADDDELDALLELTRTPTEAPTPPPTGENRKSCQAGGFGTGALLSLPSQTSSSRAESPSPNHRRKPSIRSMGKNFIAKINNAPASGASLKTTTASDEYV